MTLVFAHAGDLLVDGPLFAGPVVMLLAGVALMVRRERGGDSGAGRGRHRSGA